MSDEWPYIVRAYDQKTGEEVPVQWLPTRPGTHIGGPPDCACGCEHPDRTADNPPRVCRHCGRPIELRVISLSGDEPTWVHVEPRLTCIRPAGRPLDRVAEPAARKAAAERGNQVPAMVFPIIDEQTLLLRLREYHEARGRLEQLRQHIVKRARAMEAMHLLPEEWRP